MMKEFKRTGKLLYSNDGRVYLINDNVLWNAAPDERDLRMVLLDNNIRYGDTVRVTLTVEKIENADPKEVS